jgi:hypothetical protein
MPNSSVKRHLESIRNIRPNSSDDEKLKFLKNIEFAVSKALNKSVIQEGLNYLYNY